MKFFKRMILWGVVLCTTVFIGTLLIYFWVAKSAEGKLYTSVDSIPYNKVGLLLGTSKYIHNGMANPYYDFRVDAAVKLFNAHKISYILVSGDNATLKYNEPQMFKKDLIAQGIPEKNIFLDYAGFRTFDSVIRCSAIFGQENFTIISQTFHNERALFIAKHEHLNAIAFDAQAVTSKSRGIGMKIREGMARVKMLMDFITRKEPKFLGEKIIIPE